MPFILLEECTRRHENNLCYKCGKPGHLIRNCCAKDKKSTVSNNKSTLGCTSLDNEIEEITSELEHICLEDDKSSSLSSSRIEIFTTICVQMSNELQTTQALLNSGATKNFVSQMFLVKNE